MLPAALDFLLGMTPEREDAGMAFTVMAPRRIVFGGGVLDQIREVLSDLGVSRPLIVSDPFLCKSPLFDLLAGPLRQAKVRYSVFQCPTGEPTTLAVDAGLQLLEAADVDCLIAFGGGSPMDTAKAMALLYAGGGGLRDWKVPKTADMVTIPLICIPTTAGTGSEVTPFTVITDCEVEPEEKMLIKGAACVPAVALIDWHLTRDLPPRQTADTGLDALTHALEAYVSQRNNPHSDALALSALGLIAPNLRRAYTDPHHGPAREAMMFGASQAGMAFAASSVGLVHGMSRPIGAFFHVPHGLSNAMLLPVVTAFSLSGAPDRYATAARAMGWALPGDDTATANAKLISGLEALNRDLSVPGPSGCQIAKGQWDTLLPTMAAQALASGSPANNPRVPNAEEIVAVYRQAWS